MKLGERSIHVLFHLLHLINPCRDLHIYSLDDGSCMTATNLDEEVSTHTSVRIKERPRPRDTWVWRSLSVSYIEEVGNSLFRLSLTLICFIPSL